jgi:hypothetical protein
MFMAYSIFTHFTVIEVLANAAFVSHTNDRSNTASIASNTYMCMYRVSLVIGRRRFEQIFVLDQLIKDFRSILVKFLTNQLLNGLSWR